MSNQCQLFSLFLMGTVALFFFFSLAMMKPLHEKSLDTKSEWKFWAWTLLMVGVLVASVVWAIFVGDYLDARCPLQQECECQSTSKNFIDLSESIDALGRSTWRLGA